MIQSVLIFGKTHGKNGNNLQLYREEWKGRRARQLGCNLTNEEQAEIDAFKTMLCQQLIKKDEQENFANDPVYTDQLGGYNSKWFKPRHTNYKDWAVDKVK